MPQPEGQPKYNDLIDIIIQSSQKTIDVQQKDGSYTKEQIIDDEMKERTTKKFIKTRHYNLDPTQAVSAIDAAKAYNEKAKEFNIKYNKKYNINIFN